jgi:hypothetical protein
MCACARVETSSMFLSPPSSLRKFSLTWGVSLPVINR